MNCDKCCPINLTPLSSHEWEHGCEVPSLPLPLVRGGGDGGVGGGDLDGGGLGEVDLETGGRVSKIRSKNRKVRSHIGKVVSYIDS